MAANRAILKGGNNKKKTTKDGQKNKAKTSAIEIGSSSHVLQPTQPYQH